MNSRPVVGTLRSLDVVVDVDVEVAPAVADLMSSKTETERHTHTHADRQSHREEEQDTTQTTPMRCSRLGCTSFWGRRLPSSVGACCWECTRQNSRLRQTDRKDCVSGTDGQKWAVTVFLEQTKREAAPIGFL